MTTTALAVLSARERELFKLRSEITQLRKAVVFCLMEGLSVVSTRDKGIVGLVSNGGKHTATCSGDPDELVKAALTLSEGGR